MTTQVLPGTRTSYSRFSTWLRCPKKYRLRYIDEAVEEVTAPALVFGTAVHESCELFFRSLQRGNPAGLDEMLGVFTRALTDSVALAEEQASPVAWAGSSLKDMLAKGETMLATFHQQVDRKIRVVGVETEFEIELAPGHFATGVIDLILDDGNGHYRVIDLKTASATFGEDRLLHDHQATLYLMAAERILAAPGQVDFEFWLLMKTKSPALKILPVVRDSRDKAELIETIHEVDAAIASRVFPRIRGFACLGCEYADRCGRT